MNLLALILTGLGLVLLLGASSEVPLNRQTKNLLLVLSCISIGLVSVIELVVGETSIISVWIVFALLGLVLHITWK